jgi:hypothetical protein
MRRSIVLLLCAALRLSSQAAPENKVIEYGFEQRVRNEDWNNIFDFNDTLDDQRVQVRYRTRLWMKAPLSNNIDFSVGLNQETNQIITPDRPFKFDEVMFETAYIDVKKLFVKGLTLRVGRQNLMKGEGFLIFEGSPGDGSRTIYFNAAVLGYTWKKSKLELIGISDPRMDRYLPRIHDRSKALFDWNEQAIGSYYTDTNLKNTAIEAYYFYKKETGDLRPSTNFQFQGDRHISTAGGRVVQKLGRGYSLTGEMALQWGAQHPNYKVSGRGGYTYLKKTFGKANQHYVLGGYIGMSGDDPSTTSKLEGWDPLFSRWPKYSELYVYSQFRERGPSYWTNTGMWQAEMGYSPVKPVNVRFTYYRMNAFYPFNGDSRTFGKGLVRGNMPQIRVDYIANRHWRGHALYEHLAPGSFYSYGSPSYFLRFEVIYAYLGSVKVGSSH